VRQQLANFQDDQILSKYLASVTHNVPLYFLCS